MRGTKRRVYWLSIFKLRVCGCQSNPASLCPISNSRSAVVNNWKVLMKKITISTCLILLAGCVNSQSTDFTNAVPGCKSATASVNNQPVTTLFCIKSIAGQPSKYRVSLNNQAVFTGTDYERVAFVKAVKEGTASGGCNEMVEVHASNTQKPVAFKDLPADLVSACHITSDAEGNSQAFNKDAACDKVFYKALMPLLGKVIPVEVARQCTVKMGVQTVFEERFNF